MFFVTFCLVDSYPFEKESSNQRIQSYEEQKRHFGRIDQAMDARRDGNHWLKNPQVAQMMADSLHHRDGNVYDLDTFTIMSNHVHLLMTPLQKTDGSWIPLQEIMHSLKGYSARKANQLLGRSGQFWQHEGYDHYVRDDAEAGRIRNYIVMNPVKAGIVENWEEFPWTYSKIYGE